MHELNKGGSTDIGTTENAQSVDKRYESQAGGILEPNLTEKLMTDMVTEGEFRNS